MAEQLVAQAVQLGLRVGHCGGRGLSGELAFQGLVEAFDLGMGLGLPFFWAMPRLASRYSKPSTTNTGAGTAALIPSPAQGSTMIAMPSALR